MHCPGLRESCAWPVPGPCEVLALLSFWCRCLSQFSFNPNLPMAGGSSYNTHLTEEMEGQRGNITHAKWHSW